MDAGHKVERRLRVAAPLPFALGLVLLVQQLISPDRAWSWPLVALCCLLGLSYFWARMLRDRVSAARQVVGTWVVSGDELRERFTMYNEGSLPVLWARVRDHSEVPGYRAERVESAEAHSERRWTYTGICQRRGVFRLGPWDLEMSDPFGFFAVTHHYLESTTIVVYPRAARLPELDLPRGRAAGRASRAERAAQETTVVGGIRDYLAGDSLRRVHWPATPRHDRLMVREFEREPTGDLWLILDMDAAVQAGAEAEATQEYGVIMAASLAGQLLRQGERRAVGLLVSGRRPALLAPARGPAQLWRILGALAEAEPLAGQALPGLLKTAVPSLGSGRTLVLITPSQDPDWVGALLPLMARGNAPAAVLLDATSFAPAGGSVAALLGLRAVLASQRIPTTVIAQGFPFRPVERIRRLRQELKTLPGTGRVVAVALEEEV